MHDRAAPATQARDGRNTLLRRKQRWHRPGAVPAMSLHARCEFQSARGTPPTPTVPAPRTAAASGVVDAGLRNRRSSFGKEGGNLVGGDRAFADDAPAHHFVAEVDDGGSDVARRYAAVYD